MSQVVKIKPSTKLNLDKKKHFHRALDLNMNIGSQTLRDLANLYLQKKGMSLKQHIDEQCVKKTIKQHKDFSQEQFQTLSSNTPSLQEMDISLLSVLLLKTFPEHLSQKAKQCIQELKVIRNKLAHPVKAELDDDTLFNEARQSIMNLGNEISIKRKNYSRDLFSDINDIRLQEIVYSHCNLDRIKLNNEMYVLKVVESTGNEEVNVSSALKIKIGLTKWVRQLTRGIDVSLFLQSLKEENVISYTTKRQIEEAYSYEEQMQLLVLHMMNETTFNLCKLCQCLRQTSHVMADLVENSNTDGKEVEQYLKDYEEEKIKRILKDNFTERENKSITTELVHIFVEEQFGFTMAFKKIHSYVTVVFPDARCTTEYFSFVGLTWKNDAMERNEDVSLEYMDDADVSLMTCESFASFMGERTSELDKKTHKSIDNSYS